MWKSVREFVGFPSSEEFRQISEATVIASYATIGWDLCSFEDHVDIKFTTKVVSKQPILEGLQIKKLAHYDPDSRTLNVSTAGTRVLDQEGYPTAEKHSNLTSTMLHEYGHLIYRFGFSDQAQVNVYRQIQKIFKSGGFKDFLIDMDELVANFVPSFQIEEINDYADRYSVYVSGHEALISAIKKHKDTLSEEKFSFYKVLSQRIALMLEYFRDEEIFAGSFTVFALDSASRNGFLSLRPNLSKAIAENTGCLRRHDSSGKWYLDKFSSAQIIQESAPITNNKV